MYIRGVEFEGSNGRKVGYSTYVQQLVVFSTAAVSNSGIGVVGCGVLCAVRHDVQFSQQTRIQYAIICNQVRHVG